MGRGPSLALGMTSMGPGIGDRKRYLVTAREGTQLLITFADPIIWQPCFTEKDCFGETPKPTRETRALPFFRNLPAPPQNLRFCTGCFSLLDVAIAIVE